MGAFEEIIATSYDSNHDGTWSGGPCHTCGSQTYLLDPTPRCLVCTHHIEDADVAIELLSQHLDRLNELGPLLPDEQKRALRHQAEFWLIHLSKLLLAVSE